jgi:mRNA interferase HigB
VQIIALKTLREFWQSHASAEASLRAWYHEARLADWRSFQDIKNRYPHADVLPDNRVVFDLKGNTYRLVARINYQSGCIFIRFVGTHAAYDKIDARTI